MLFVVLGTHSNKNVNEEVWPDLDFLASCPGAFPPAKWDSDYTLRIQETVSRFHIGINHSFRDDKKLWGVDKPNAIPGGYVREQ